MTPEAQATEGKNRQTELHQTSQPLFLEGRREDSADCPRKGRELADQALDSTCTTSAQRTLTLTTRQPSLLKGPEQAVPQRHTLADTPREHRSTTERRAEAGQHLHQTPPEGPQDADRGKDRQAATLRCPCAGPARWLCPCQSSLWPISRNPAQSCNRFLASSLKHERN